MAVDLPGKQHSIFMTARLVKKINMQLNRHDYWGDNIPGRPADLSYVKQIPPPITESKGAKILARTFTPAVYNPSSPTRYEVWKGNYARRHDQMNAQGFMSVTYEPYKSIGHPVHLDNEVLVTDALGLPSKGKPGNNVPASQDPAEDASKAVQPAPSKYIPRRPRRDLNTLKKEIGEGRSLLQSVKLGSGLFPLLRQRWDYKVTKKERALEKERELALMSWQMPGSDSDSDDAIFDASANDDELNGEADISKYLPTSTHLNAEYNQTATAPEDLESQGATFKIRSESQQHTKTTSKSTDDLFNASERAHSAPVSNSKRRKKQLAARPYTPNHQNIATKTPPAATVGDSLFNQLCVLYWLLEAMDIPDASMMTPLLTSWSLREVGGREIKNRKKHEERKLLRETEYTSLLKPGKAKETASKKGPKASEKKTIQWMVRQSRADSITGYGSAAPSTSPRESTAGWEPADMLSRLEESTASFQRIPDDDAFTYEQLDMAPADEELVPSANARRLAAGISETARPASEARKSGALAVQAVAEGRKSAQPAAQAPRAMSMHFQPTREELRQLELVKQLEEIARCENMPMERLSSRALRFSSLANPKVSKEVAAFKASCLSVKADSLVTEGRQLWLDVKEEEALKLHDQLEYLDKHRLKNCQSKFLAMTTNANGFHRALSTMRLKSEMWRREEEKLQNSQKDKRSLYAEWYLDLCSITSHDQRKLWYFNEILEKLKKFGMKYHPEEKTESSSKASEIKFLTVLRSLRTWEICSPDVAAAIEFCRESVIEMAADVYEEFLRHDFPSIVRSNVLTANQPPSSGSSHDNVKS